MPQEKKLTRQMINDALGKKIDSKEFKVIMDILGEPEIETDMESDRTDYSWDHYGINIVINHEAETFDNIVLYPYGSTSEFEYINDRKPCKYICKDNDFDQNITMKEVREKYGKPNTEKETYLGYVMRYRNLNGYTIFFTFSSESQLYSTMIGTRD